MKVSKFLHSCLVFELEGYKLLFDPGKFSFAEGLVKPEMFADVNGIIITHIHPDHLDIENLKKITELSKAPVYANNEVAAKINREGLNAIILEPGNINIGPFRLKAISVIHEPLLDNPIPQMMAFLINDKVLHPVDSMEESLLAYKGVELLILVVMAPFTNELKIADFADKIKPKQIMPVHDGYAKEFFIKQRYENYSRHFQKQGIKFNEIYKIGESISI